MNVWWLNFRKEPLNQNSEPLSFYRKCWKISPKKSFIFSNSSAFYGKLSIDALGKLNFPTMFEKQIIASHFTIWCNASDEIIIFIIRKIFSYTFPMFLLLIYFHIYFIRCALDLWKCVQSFDVSRNPLDELSVL